jgi:hypothetical protein
LQHPDPAAARHPNYTSRQAHDRHSTGSQQGPSAGPPHYTVDAAQLTPLGLYARWHSNVLQCDRSAAICIPTLEARTGNYRPCDTRGSTSRESIGPALNNHASTSQYIPHTIAFRIGQLAHMGWLQPRRGSGSAASPLDCPALRVPLPQQYIQHSYVGQTFIPGWGAHVTIVIHITAVHRASAAARGCQPAVQRVLQVCVCVHVPCVLQSSGLRGWPIPAQPSCNCVQGS